MSYRLERTIGLLTLSGLLLVTSLTGTAAAQYAPHFAAQPIPCVDGNCRFDSNSFGYHQPRWRRWPVAQASARMPLPRGEQAPLDPTIPAFEAPSIEGEADITPRPKKRLPSRSPLPAPRGDSPRGPSLLDPPTNDLPPGELPPTLTPTPRPTTPRPTTPQFPPSDPPPTRPQGGSSDLDLSPRPSNGGTDSSDLTPPDNNRPFDPFGMGQRTTPNRSGWTAARREAALQQSLFAPRSSRPEVAQTPRESYSTTPQTFAANRPLTLRRSDEAPVPPRDDVPQSADPSREELRPRRTIAPTSYQQPSTNYQPQTPNVTTNRYYQPMASQQARPYDPARSSAEGSNAAPLDSRPVESYPTTSATAPRSRYPGLASPAPTASTRPAPAAGPRDGNPLRSNLLPVGNLRDDSNSAGYANPLR